VSAGRTVAEGVDGLRTLVGAPLGPTRPITLEQRRVDAFAAATRDPAPLEHGFLTLSLIAQFMPQLLELRDIAMGVNYGLERVRFPGVPRVGAELFARGRVLAIVTKPGGAQMTARIEILTTDGLCCVADVVFRYYGES
jgi:acyl dehydratase